MIYFYFLYTLNKRVIKFLINKNQTQIQKKIKRIKIRFKAMNFKPFNFYLIWIKFYSIIHQIQIPHIKFKFYHITNLTRFTYNCKNLLELKNSGKNHAQISIRCLKVIFSENQTLW